MTDHPLMNVIGCGQAAGSLVRLWREAGVVDVGAVKNRSLQSSREAVTRVGGGEAASSLAAMPVADYWLIGTTDQAIGPVTQQLADEFSAKGPGLQNSLVFHLAGRYGLERLQPAAEQGALVAAMHPVRSLTHARLTREEFAGTACVAEGDDAALSRLKPLVEGIGGHWMPVSNIERGLYHAALSVVSNVTKAVTWKAENWLVSSGLPPETAESLVHELLDSTVQDLFRSGARKSITGPVVRGDTSTIAAHLRAVLDTHPQDLDVYRILVRTILELAQDRGDLEPEKLQRFTALLRNPGPP